LSPVDLRTIAAPTLLLAGNHSPAVIKGIVASLGRELPNRRVRWLDSGHMGPITDAHLVNPLIETFVDSCTGRDDVHGGPRAVVAPAALAAAGE
jgi:pimeloyl-ACP methyl ester carboxylesterase